MSENEAILNHRRIELQDRLFSQVRDVPDFPKPGIIFKDINPVFADSMLSKKIIALMSEVYVNNKPDVIVGIESRGFFFGFPLALALDIPFVPIRKKGKLPGDVLEKSFGLEYGDAVIEVQKNALQKGQKVLIHDDVLATGGTALAAADLVLRSGASVYGFNFIIELSFLKGIEKLQKTTPNIYNLAST